MLSAISLLPRATSFSKKRRTDVRACTKMLHRKLAMIMARWAEPQFWQGGMNVDEVISGSWPRDRRRAMVSLGERLDARNGVGHGFDHLRVGLALSILIWHSFGISYGLAWTRSDPVVTHLRPLLSSLLPMFFALSGFLVMGSALRINNLRTFITFRVLRIVPALATEISLSALIVGPLLTAMSLGRYFNDPRFFEYFGSLIGRVKYVLPGLFLNTPTPEVVNGALWTVGPEIFCYIVMSLLILTTLYLYPRLMAIFTLVYLILCIISDAVLPPRLLEVLPTKALILAFLTGNILFHYRYKIPFSFGLACAAAVIGLGGLALAQTGGMAVMLIYPAVALLAFVVAFIGLCDLPPLPFFHRGDYSYGIYIFGFPIQQTVTQFLPDHRIWWVNLSIALPVTLVFAVASWHLIEKPTLGLRKRLGGGPKVLPKPPRDWNKHSLALATGLAAYGFFVAMAADVFPIWRVYTHFTHQKLVVGQPPPGI